MITLLLLVRATYMYGVFYILLLKTSFAPLRCLLFV